MSRVRDAGTGPLRDGEVVAPASLPTLPTAKSETIDPITIATIWHYMQRVCREMRYTAERTATDVLVVTLHDIETSTE